MIGIHIRREPGRYYIFSVNCISVGHVDIKNSFLKSEVMYMKQERERCPDCFATLILMRSVGSIKDGKLEATIFYACPDCSYRRIIRHEEVLHDSRCDTQSCGAGV